MRTEQGVSKPWTRKEIRLLAARIPKDWESRFSVEAPVKKEPVNLDEKHPLRRATTPQNLGLVIMASRTGALLDLPLGQREILQERYLSEDPSSFSDLARRSSVTRQRIAQIEQDALEKIKPH